MKDNIKLYLEILGISLIVLFLEVVLFKIVGVLGLIICILCVYFIVATSIRIIRLMDIFDDEIMEKIDILFYL